MFSIIITIILTSAFFILFFNQETKNKKKDRERESVPEISTTAGFEEDTYRGPITDRFIPPKVGDVGTFMGYAGVANFGFPYEVDENSNSETQNEDKSPGLDYKGISISNENPTNKIAGGDAIAEGRFALPN